MLQPQQPSAKEKAKEEEEEEEASTNNWSTYKRAQVRCKQTPPNYHDLQNLPGFVDFGCLAHSFDKNGEGDNTMEHADPRILTLKTPTPNENNSNNSQSYYQGPAFGLSEFPGFIFFPQALSECLQTQLAFESVTDFCEAPHATNIDLVAPKSHEVVNGEEETLWHLWKTEHGFATATNKGQASSAAKDNPNKKYYRSFRKLSWATTGYHYDWTQRSYHEGAKSIMPPSLQKVATLFAQTALRMEQDESSPNQSTTTTYTTTKFTPSASIVNYYTFKSVMGGHRDDLEYALDKPVVSMSLGLPAMFLLGGNTKESAPVLPILVRPGDVMILGGAARLNYHGMAKVLPPRLSSIHNDDDGAAAANGDHVPASSSWEKHPQQVTTELLLRETILETQEQEKSSQATTTITGKHQEIVTIQEEDQKALTSFLSQYRLNINVRQVHKD